MGLRVRAPPRLRAGPAQPYSACCFCTHSLKLRAASAPFSLLSRLTRPRPAWLREKGRLGRVPEAEADAKVESRSQAALKQLLVPARVPGLNQVVTVAAGWYCSYAITRSGAVYAWGVNNYGQLALPRITSATVPPYYAPTHSPALSGAGRAGAREPADETLTLRAGCRRPHAACCAACLTRHSAQHDASHVLHCSHSSTPATLCAAPPMNALSPPPQGGEWLRSRPESTTRSRSFPPGKCSQSVREENDRTPRGVFSLFSPRPASSRLQLKNASSSSPPARARDVRPPRPPRAGNRL